ncbi:MAG: ATP phosphoribosyltransferase regulatory subunit [bacterium]
MDASAQTKAMPAGTRVLLPGRAEAKRRVEARLLEVFHRWGFREIVTPALDLYDPRAGGEVRDEQTFRLVDRETGGMLALRADLTPQIARLAGTLFAGHPRPLRLCYVTNVFRHAYASGVLQREFWQAGVELIGLVSLEADVEMIAIAVECLRCNGVDRLKMSLSHTAYLRGLMEGLGLEGGRRAEVLEALARRDVTGLEGLLRGLRSRNGSARALLALPEMFGGKEVLARAARRVKNRTSLRALAELRQVQEMLELYGLADRVLFDLSDFRDFDYYTGVIFEGFVEGAGYPVCGGGRYDRLLGRYGTDGLGTGFAVDLDQLLAAAPGEGGEAGGADFLVIDFTREKRAGITLARGLRERGWRVARDIIRRDLNASLEYARETGVSRCLVVDRAGGGAGRVRMVDPAGRELGRFAVEEAAARIGRPEGEGGE